MKFFVILISLSIFLPLFLAGHASRVQKLQSFFSKSRNEVLNGTTDLENYDILHNLIAEWDEIFSKENETTLNMTKLEFLQNKAALKKLITNAERTEEVLETDLQKELDEKQRKEEEEQKKSPVNDTNFVENRHLQFIDSEDELDDPEYQKVLKKIQ
jgi:hypothetical protein